MSAHDEGMVSRGVVREWNDDEGFGVIDSPETHFSCLVTDEYRTPAAGDLIAFTFAAGRQDGYDYRAIWIRPRPPRGSEDQARTVRKFRRTS